MKDSPRFLQKNVWSSPFANCRISGITDLQAAAPSKRRNRENVLKSPETTLLHQGIGKSSASKNVFLEYLRSG
jgi:hypothetical protein